MIDYTQEETADLVVWEEYVESLSLPKIEDRVCGDSQPQPLTDLPF
jgi:hypothetical protein